MVMMQDENRSQKVLQCINVWNRLALLWQSIHIIERKLLTGGQGGTTQKVMTKVTTTHQMGTMNACIKIVPINLVDVQTCFRCWIKRQMMTKVTRNYALETINVFTKCWDTSAWLKAVDGLADQHCHPKSCAATVAKKDEESFYNHSLTLERSGYTT